LPVPEAVAFDPALFPHEAVTCNLCGGTDHAVVASTDRYGLPTRIVQCTCGLRFITPRMTAEGYAAFYRDGYRPLLTQLTGKSHNASALQSEQLYYANQLICEVFRYLPKAGSLLDVGGSTGTVSRAFRAVKGYAVTVIDPSPEELAKAKGCRTICGSAETVDFPVADVALLARTVDHLLDPLGVLRRLRENTSWLIADAMDVDAWPAHVRYKVDHPYAFTAETFRALVRAAGWDICHTWTWQKGRYTGLIGR
jgi:hypothetical protein